MVKRMKRIMLLVVALGLFFCPALQAAKTAPIYVETKKVQLEKFIEHLILKATASAERETMVKAPMAGKVISLAVKVGDRVKSNQTLAFLQDKASQEALALAESDYAAAKKAYDKGVGKKKNTKAWRETKRAYEKALTVYEEKQNAGRPLEIKAPFAGEVTDLTVAAGDSITADREMVKMIDISSLVLSFTASYEDIDLVKTVSPLKISFDEEKVLAATIAAQSGTSLVLRVDNSMGTVTVGSVGTLKVVKKEYTDVAVVPKGAVARDEKGAYVLVARKNKAKKLYVTTGPTEEGVTALTSGLLSDEILILQPEKVLPGQKIALTPGSEPAAPAVEAKKAPEAVKEKKEVKVQAPREEGEEKASSLSGKNLFSIGPVISSVSVKDENFKTFYSSSKMVFGGEINVPIMDRFVIFGSVKSYKDTAETTYYKLPLEFKMAYNTVGLRYIITDLGYLRPYVGAGLEYISYKETKKSLTGETLNKTSDNAMGFSVGAGTYLRLESLPFVEGNLFFNYNSVKDTIDETDFDLSGVEFGLGIMIRI